MFGKLFGKKSKDEPAPKAPPAPEPKKAPPAPEARGAAPPASGAKTGPLPPVDPPRGANAAPSKPGDTVGAMARDAQAGAAALGDAAAQIERAIRAGQGANGAPISPDAVLALRAAAESLAASADAPAKAATAAIKAGNLGEAFKLLRQEADTAQGPAQVERLRRLGALAYLTEAGVALDAYQTAFFADSRDFWQNIFLARLRGLAGRLDLSHDAATAALGEARTPKQTSQAEAELALIALGRSDAAGARSHGQSCVSVLRNANEPLELAQRLSLLGDIAVILGDQKDADAAYSESLGLVRQLGAAAPADTNLARAAADTQEKLAAVIGRQGRHADAMAAGGQAVDLRRRLLAARPGEVADVTALATALNTHGEICRLAGDAVAAAKAYTEALETARKAVTMAPGGMAAHREIWVGLWRMAQLPDAKVPWREVVSAMEAAKKHGALLARDEDFYQEARRRAGLA
jgi:hypothetical protein